MRKMLNRYNEGKKRRAGGIHGLRRVHALTLIELLIVVAILGILAGLFLPLRSDNGRRSPQIRCMSNLKQAGLSLLLWREDNNNLYPMQYFTNADGSMKFANAANGYRYFTALSNYLHDPEFLVCPMDKGRVRMTNWASNFSGLNISYFLALDTTGAPSNEILLGDSNITNGQQPRDGILYVTTNQAVGWTPERHDGFGIVAFADNHVTRRISANFPSTLAQTGLPTNRLLIP